MCIRDSIITILFDLISSIALLISFLFIPLVHFNSTRVLKPSIDASIAVYFTQYSVAKPTKSTFSTFLILRKSANPVEASLALS